MKRVLRNRLRSRVIVTLKSGASFRGVLFDADSQAVVLRDVEHLVERAGPNPVDGELVLLTADLLYLQLV